MIAEVTVRLSIADHDADDPFPGTPREKQLLDAVQEAVDNALRHGEDVGFAHALEEQTAIEYFRVTQCERSL